MGGFSDNVEDAVLNQVLRGTPYGIPLAQRISLHHHDPDPYGGNEIAGAAYTRRPALWAEASGGVSVLAEDVVWEGLPTAEVAWWGLWTSGGVYVGSGLIGFQRYVATTGLLDTLTTPTAHQLVDNVAVRVTEPESGALPTPLDTLVTYYVVGATPTTLKLALALGGPAIDLGAAGTGYVRPIRRIEDGDGLILSAGITTFALD